MKTLFADTSLFLAFLNARDEFHELSVAYVTEPSCPLITTVWVLVELGNYLAKSRNRRRFASFVQDLRKEPNVEIIPADNDHFERGLSLYDLRPDKKWS